MSARASLGSAYALATAPGTARAIYSGHDGSTSGDSSRIVKLIRQLQPVSHTGRIGDVANMRQRARRTPRPTPHQPARPDPQLRGPRVGVNMIIGFILSRETSPRAAPST